MSKKIMKRSLALGALMAFVITGSAMAEGTTDVGVADDPSGVTSVAGIYGDPDTQGDSGKTTWNVNGQTLHITAPYNNSAVGGAAVYGEREQFCFYDSTTTNLGTFLIKATEGNTITQGIVGVGVIKNLNKLEIHVDTVALSAYDGDITISNVKTVEIVSSDKANPDSSAMTAAGESNQGNIKFENVENLIIDTYKGIEVGKGKIEIETKNLTITTAENANAIEDLYGLGDGVAITVTEKADVKGNIVTDGGDNSKVSLSMNTADSVFEGKVITNKGNTSLGLNNGATWNVTGVSTVSELSGNDANIVVSNVTGTQVTIKDDQTEQMTVSASADATGMTGNYATDLQAIANSVVENVKSEDGNTTTTQAAATTAAITGDAIYEEISSEVKVDANGKAEINASDINTVMDRGNVSANDMMAVGLMTWRAGTNDMNKRMGELRDSNGEHGVWVRMVRGEQEYQSVKNQYNQYQLGYDEKLSVDKRWIVGAAISYIDAKNSFSNGNGESTDKSLAIYGSKLNDDGSFIDLIAKYGRLENEFELYTGMKDAEYDTNAYSFSAEFGKRFKQGKGMWIEPQVELTYGKVASVDYVSSRGVKIAQDSMESLIGRVGFRLGKDIKQGNIYARASYLYDFDGETSATLDNKATLEQDLGGGWWEVGVGANINLSDATYIYADVEKTFGGEVDTNWQWNLGVRYSF